jgi:nucleoside-diphosphate-sugar epimerase
MIGPGQLDERTVLVTGASGFIGSHLCKRLLDGGARVHAISRRVGQSQPTGISWHQIDLADSAGTKALTTAIRPELIFHLASYVSGSRELTAVIPTLHCNLVSTVNLLIAATEVGCKRMVLAGSLEEPPPGEAVATPASPYAAAKAASSAYGRMFHALYGTPVVLARLFMVYGPGQQDLRKLVPYTSLALLRGEVPQLSSGTRPVDWIYVDDVVSGLLVTACAPGIEGQSIDLGSGQLVTVREVVDMLVQITGAQVTPRFGSIADRPFEQVRIADAATTTARTAWLPITPLEEGLRQTVAWYAQLLRAGDV